MQKLNAHKARDIFGPHQDLRFLVHCMDKENPRKIDKGPWNESSKYFLRQWGTIYGGSYILFAARMQILAKFSPNSRHYSQATIQKNN